MSQAYDYGPAGIVGIATPQANPTVEAEMRILLPPTILPVTARLTSRAGDSETRLRDYLRDLVGTIAQFDTLRPYALGFACTGSSYFVEPGEAERIVDAAETRFGYPVITATAAIAQTLAHLGARRIALASPYPNRLAAAAQTYWERAGFEVAAVRQVAIAGPDTRNIYALSSASAAPAVEELRKLPVDVVLLSGTGMPSLPLLVAASGTPLVISSNQCLADRLVSLAPRYLPDRDGWPARLADATLSLSHS